MEKGVNEKDWKLFRSRLPGWQETYMEKVDTGYFAVTHIFPVEEKITQLRAVEEKYPFKLLIPNDGDTLEL